MKVEEHCDQNCSLFATPQLEQEPARSWISDASTARFPARLAIPDFHFQRALQSTHFRFERDRTRESST